MSIEYAVGIIAVDEVVEEGFIKDKGVFNELMRVAAKYRRGCSCSGSFPGCHEGFMFFNLDDALGFMKETSEKPYVVAEILLRDDRYSKMVDEVKRLTGQKE